MNVKKSRKTQGVLKTREKTEALRRKPKEWYYMKRRVYILYVYILFVCFCVALNVCFSEPLNVAM